MTFKGRLENLDSEVFGFTNQSDIHFNSRRISVWQNFVNGRARDPSVIKEFL